MARRRGVRAGAAFALTLVCAPLSYPAEAIGGEPPCRASFEIDPPASYVGQQQLHRVRIAWRDDVSRVEWLRAPGFPDHRLIPLPPRAGPDERAGWQTREERRALFAGRPGRLVVSSTTLRCVIESDASARHFDLELPPRRLAVRSAPDPGRPADFDGLIGPVELARSADRVRAVLGESIRVTIGLTGEGNVWVAALGGGLKPEGSDSTRVAYDVFPVDERSASSHDERLVTRRVARFDVVPRQTGRLLLPAWTLSWLDPTSGLYRTSSAPPISIDVSPATPAAARAAGAAATGGADTAERADPSASAPSSSPHPSLLRTAIAAIAVAGAAFAAGWLLFRARSGRRALDAALRTADAARGSGDRRGEAEALDRALRAALAERSPALAGLSPPELEARSAGDEPLAEAAGLLADLEDARFGAHAREPDREAIRTWLAANLR